MANLADTAQVTMDLYYQNYKTDEDFFNLTHFIYLCGVAYSKLLEDEYKETRREARAEAAMFMDIFLADDWLVDEIVQMKKDEDDPESFIGKLTKPLFSFPFDQYSFGLQDIRRLGDTTCNQFVRTSAREVWMDCDLPVMNNRVFFYVSGGTLYVKRPHCKVDKLKVRIVPEISDGSFGANGGPVPKAKEDTIIRKTLELMKRAKEGEVVDMSNNSNPNKVMQNEIDNLFPNLRTKP